MTVGITAKHTYPASFLSVEPIAFFQPNADVVLVLAADPISGPIFPNKGDQERFWRMTRRFVEALAQQTGATRCASN
jgi:hypothetical protein